MANGEYPLAATWTPVDPTVPAVQVEGVGGTSELRPCKYRVINSYTWTPTAFTFAELDGANAIAANDRLLNTVNGIAPEGVYIATSATSAVLSTTDVVTAGKSVICTHSAIKGPFMFVE
jgi:hypothetical protein